MARTKGPSKKQKSNRLLADRITLYEEMGQLRGFKTWDDYIEWLLEQDLQNKKRLLQEKLEEISKNDM